MIRTFISGMHGLIVLGSVFVCGIGCLAALVLSLMRLFGQTQLGGLEIAAIAAISVGFFLLVFGLEILFSGPGQPQKAHQETVPIGALE